MDRSVASSTVARMHADGWLSVNRRVKVALERIPAHLRASISAPAPAPKKSNSSALPDAHRVASPSPHSARRPPPRLGGERSLRYVVDVPGVDSARLSVTVATSADGVQQWVDSRLSKELVVGLDCEWRPTFQRGRPQNPIALVQLAQGSEVLLVRVAAMPTFPDALCSVLQDDTFIKVGVGVTGDADKLAGDFGVAVRGVVDAGEAYRRYLTGRPPTDAAGPGPAETLSLRRLAADILGVSNWKSKRVTLSNWEGALNPRQVSYAALDAWCSFAIVDRLGLRAADVMGMRKGVSHAHEHGEDGGLGDGDNTTHSGRAGGGAAGAAGAAAAAAAAAAGTASAKGGGRQRTRRRGAPHESVGHDRSRVRLG